MKKKVLLIMSLIMCLGLLVGCGGIKEKKVNDMVYLDTWYFTSGLMNNRIYVNHSDDDVDFICVATNGKFWVDGTQEANESIVVKAGSTFSWREYDDDIIVTEAYIKIVVKKDNIIIGYALIEINSNGDLNYNAKVLKSILFPKVNGNYQDVSEEYVNQTIEKTIGKKV